MSEDRGGKIGGKDGDDWSANQAIRNRKQSAWAQEPELVPSGIVYGNGRRTSAGGADALNPTEHRVLINGYLEVSDHPIRPILFDHARSCFTATEIQSGEIQAVAQALLLTFAVPGWAAGRGVRPAILGRRSQGAVGRSEMCDRHGLGGWRRR